MFSIDVVAAVSPKRPMYLLIVGSHYCVVRFAYALHMCKQYFVPFPCLYIELFELVIEVIFHYCTTPPCHILFFLIAFITGNSSLEPLIEGLCAQIHVNLR